MTDIQLLNKFHMKVLSRKKTGKSHDHSCLSS